MKIPVEGHPNLYKDSDSGLICQESNYDRELYRNSRRQALMQVSLVNEVDCLKKEMSEIKKGISDILKFISQNNLNNSNK